MTSYYWQKREAAKEYIITNLRDHLLNQYKGLPVYIIREKYKEIKKDNKKFIKDILEVFDCEDFFIKWIVYFYYDHDKDGMANITDFLIFTEGC